MFLSLFLSSALASIPVTVTVQDPDGAPVTTATVQVKGEAAAHEVDATTARWTAAEVELADGSTRAFEKKAVVELAVTAPGYQPVKVAYLVRKKNNQIVVELEKAK